MRGDLDLIVKQQSVTTFDVKFTPMGSWSVPVGAWQCRVPTGHLYFTQLRNAIEGRRKI